MTSMNFCNDIRVALLKKQGQSFTCKQFGRENGWINDSMSENQIEKISTKISNELLRCRAADDLFMRPQDSGFPKDKSKHAHYMADMGLQVRVTDYKPKYSEKGRRPALLYRVDSIATDVQRSVPSYSSVGNTFEQITALAIQEAKDTKKNMQHLKSWKYLAY